MAPLRDLVFALLALVFGAPIQPVFDVAPPAATTSSSTSAIERPAEVAGDAAMPVFGLMRERPVPAFPERDGEEVLAPAIVSGQSASDVFSRAVGQSVGSVAREPKDAQEHSPQAGSAEAVRVSVSAPVSPEASVDAQFRANAPSQSRETSAGLAQKDQAPPDERPGPSASSLASPKRAGGAVAESPPNGPVSNVVPVGIVLACAAVIASVWRFFPTEER